MVTSFRICIHEEINKSVQCQL